MVGLSFDGDGHLVGQLQAALEVVGLVVVHVGNENLLCHHGLRVVQTEVGRAVDVEVGVGRHPQAMAEEAVAALHAQLRRTVLQL